MVSVLLPGLEAVLPTISACRMSSWLQVLAIFGLPWEKSADYLSVLGKYII